MHEEDKWIGCLCWFWDYGYDTYPTLGRLEQYDGRFFYMIDDREEYGEYTKTCFDCCEPAKPEDINFYKEK